MKGRNSGINGSLNVSWSRWLRQRRSQWAVNCSRCERRPHQKRDHRQLHDWLTHQRDGSLVNELTSRISQQSLTRLMTQSHPHELQPGKWYLFISKNNKWQTQMLEKEKNTKKESYTEVNNYKKWNTHRGIKEFLQKLYWHMGRT